MMAAPAVSRWRRWRRGLPRRGARRCHLAWSPPQRVTCPTSCAATKRARKQRRQQPLIKFQASQVQPCILDERVIIYGNDDNNSIIIVVIIIIIITDDDDDDDDIKPHNKTTMQNMYLHLILCSCRELISSVFFQTAVHVCLLSPVPLGSFFRPPALRRGTCLAPRKRVPCNSMQNTDSYHLWYRYHDHLSLLYIYIYIYIYTYI